ncbi:MAG TPA: cohesin domain-containing protein [Nitrospirota bacterium]|nr:cohesin domain-containing protein [Nitrospirota bacterium]
MKWRKQKEKIFLMACLTTVLTFGYQVGHAASTLAISPAGDGVFVIQGAGIENAGAMDFTVLYDTSSFANPRVVQGALISGALMAVNDRTPGVVRLAIIRTTPIQGSGVIATLTFDRRGQSAGKNPSLVVNKLTNVEGNPISAGATNDTSGTSQKQETGGEPSVPGVSAAPGAPSAPVQPGVILLPGGGVAPEGKKDQTAGPQPETPAEDATASAKEPSAVPQGITASLEPQKKKVQQFMSVLERFRKNDKERTAKAFLSFFDQVEANGFRQEPSVALSDGKATVKIYFVVPSSGGAAPDFALSGARLVSIKKDADRSNTWMIEALPEKGGYEASLTVSQGDVMLDYPLVLAPKIDLKEGSKPVTDEDFGRYLSGKRKDLNGDGKRDFLDDYIFTANFIAARQKK